MKKKASIFILLLVMSYSLFAMDNLISLDEAISMAYENNTDMEVARYDLGIALRDANMASSYIPDIAISGSVIDRTFGTGVDASVGISMDLGTDLIMDSAEKSIQNIPCAAGGGKIVKTVSQKRFHSLRFQKGNQPLARRNAQRITQEKAVSAETGGKRFDVQGIGKIAASASAGKQLESGQIATLENDRLNPVFPKRKSRGQSGGSASDDRNAFHRKSLSCEYKKRARSSSEQALQFRHETRFRVPGRRSSGRTC